MPSLDSITSLKSKVEPTRTVLFLGARAAVSSGAPTSEQLCQYLQEQLAPGENISDDLPEISSILERRTSRKRLIDTIRNRLLNLEPDGALLSLARLPWIGIFTTNYDLLIEKAFQKVGLNLAVVRSNYDWESAHSPANTVLYKIHGCITQDRSYGHKASMILTYEDYDESLKYRELLYQRPFNTLAGGTAIVVGHSLRDKDIQNILHQAIQLQRQAGAPGHVHLIMYNIDAERADIWRQRGVDIVAQGDLNAFAHQLSDIGLPGRATDSTRPAFPELPNELDPTTIRVNELRETPAPRRLFSGAPANYGDIREGYTFERDFERELIEAQEPILIILGVAGVGKSTLARRVLIGRSSAENVITYEHRRDLPLLVKPWLDYERVVRESGLNAQLLIDECTQFQYEINQLVRQLPEKSALRIILTAENYGWKIRQKEPRLFSQSQIVNLSELSLREVGQLLSPVSSKPPLRVLADPHFFRLTESQQRRTLERRCRADMFVCLKVLFSTETLDHIILNEYAKLESSHQDLYRTTCALEAAGAIPHRQMILRLTNFTTSLLASSLELLEGIISESSESIPLGIYTWWSRHEVIADIISRYKFAEEKDLFALLKRVIETANPSYYIETRTLREMCTAERGIRALPDQDMRLNLFRSIAEVMPNDRVARHRLVAELISSERLGDAEVELRKAIEEVRLDPPLQRYMVLLEIARSRQKGLMEEDRRAILNNAFREAEQGIERFPDNKYMYFACADVAEEWFHLTHEIGQVTWAQMLLERAHERLLDPQIRERIVHLPR